MCPIETASVVETVLLDEMLDRECACESAHGNCLDFPGGDICTVEVVARKTVCDSSFLICDASYRWNLEVVGIFGDEPCDGCYRPLGDCWSVIPV